MGIFNYKFYQKFVDKVTGLFGADSENISKKDEIKTKEDLSQSEINFLHNHNVMMKKRVGIQRMRNKMRRATQQSQRK